MEVPGEPCYLIEWYGRLLTKEPLEQTAAKLEDCAAAMCAEGSPVRLLGLLAVPTDEVVFAVFAADSAHIAAQACRRAGLPVARLTAASTIAQAHQ
jgi:hypothetical protein